MSGFCAGFYLRKGLGFELLSICPNGSLSFSDVIQSLKLALVSPLKVFNKNCMMHCQPSYGLMHKCNKSKFMEKAI